MDSVCAPFLVLNFDREHEAFACIQAFIPRFLDDFFAYDNTHVLQVCFVVMSCEHNGAGWRAEKIAAGIARTQDSLAVFRQLLSFHDAELAAHLDDVGFHPELYAIPWFLTLYTRASARPRPGAVRRCLGR